jgi:hypothetical protein
MLASMLRIAALVVAFAALIPWWRSAPAAVPPRPEPPAPASPLIVFRGDDAAGLPVARAALERVLDTSIGAKARELLGSGTLAGPLTIELNHRGENFTEYRIPGRELGETIVFDPSSRPLVETERGREQARPETVLAHELGHAVFKLISEQDVIEAVENPVREQMGLPRRSRF